MIHFPERSYGRSNLGGLCRCSPGVAQIVKRIWRFGKWDMLIHRCLMASLDLPPSTSKHHRARLDGHTPQHNTASSKGSNSTVRLLPTFLPHIRPDAVDRIVSHVQSTKHVPFQRPLPLSAHVHVHLGLAFPSKCCLRSQTCFAQSIRILLVHSDSFEMRPGPQSAQLANIPSSPSTLPQRPANLLDIL